MKITNRNNMVVEVHNEPCDENHPYVMIDVEATFKAARNLSDDAFKLWMYFAKNPDGCSFKLSLIDAAKWGFKRGSFYKAMDELTKLGYIRDLGRDVFIFYENPENHK